MDYFSLALKTLLNELHEFTCQVELLHNKLIENKETKENLEVAEHIQSLKQIENLFYQ